MFKIRTQFPMSKTLIVALVAGGLVVSACGSEEGGTDAADISAKSSSSEIGTAYISELSQIADALESIETEADAERVAGAIQSATVKLNQMNKTLEGEMSAIKMMQLMRTNGQQFIQVQQRISSAMTNLAQTNPELLQIISREMDNLPEIN
ncbi:MAG: hypothetical protein AAGF15_11665 [Pseudomonadota bacterium]